MTAAALCTPAKSRRGLRPVDAGRDLASMARLIEEAFAGRLDANGRRLLRDLRLVSSLGWLGRLAGWLLIPSMTPPVGFVWEESQGIVGNASLLRIDGHPDRWVLANVAVDSAFRRRGIGRSLVAACLERARRLGARRLVLQVDSDRQEAEALYLSFGFRPLTARTTWSRMPGEGPTDWEASLPARRRQPEEWRVQEALAQRVHPEGLIWPFPGHAGVYRSSITPAGAGRGHWVWPAEGPIAATLSLQSAADRRGWRLVMVVSPEARGQAEGPLLDAALRHADSRGAPVVVETVPGAADRLLSERGFRMERTLTWMGLELGLEPSQV